LSTLDLEATLAVRAVRQAMRIGDERFLDRGPGYVRR
jgi:hypothetical protein